MDTLDAYFAIVVPEIHRVFAMPVNASLLRDLLLGKYIADNLRAIQQAKTLKQLQMKIGRIWQIAIGNYHGFTDLKIGHPSGLDVVSSSRQLIIEIKNRYNTDNASARSANYRKLAAYKRDHPHVTCVYGVINCKSPAGQYATIEYDGQEIQYYSGDMFLRLVFGDARDEIVTALQREIANIIGNI